MILVPSNAQAIGAREEQEDSFGFSDPDDREFMAHGGLLAVVADGMGGMAFGGEASRIAVSRFLDSYAAKTPAESVPNALLRCLNEGNDAVLAIADRYGMWDQIGTTMVCAVVGENTLHWISVGDSRIYLVRSGTVIQITFDHVYANELDRRAALGEISEAEALSMPGRENLTSYLGKQTLTEIDRSLTPLPLEPGDLILICSDGLYKAASLQDLAAITQGEAGGITDALVQYALGLERPNQDNVTVLSITCQTTGMQPVPNLG
ncbi:MAG TPA: protein phosphatase 2C domain-containing protein [Blastocatellia bacterium]